MLNLHSALVTQTKETTEAAPYIFEHLLPHFSQDNYLPLTAYNHVDPGLRALSHSDPRAFLDSATKVIDLTPKLGTEIDGINLARLDDTQKDQLALEVRSSV